MRYDLFSICEDWKEAMQGWLPQWSALKNGILHLYEREYNLAGGTEPTLPRFKS